MSDRPKISQPTVFTPTPVETTDLIGRIAKIDRMLQRVGTEVKVLPMIQDEVQGAHRKIVALDTKVDFMQERVVRAENKLDEGHKCIKDSDIRELKNGQSDAYARIESTDKQGIEALQIAKNAADDAVKLEKEVQGLDEVRRGWTKVAISAVITLLPLLGGGIWYVSSLSGEVQHNATQNREQIVRIEKRLSDLPSKTEQRELNREVSQLRVVLEQQTPARYDDVSTICRALSPSQRRGFRRQLQRLELNVPTECREE